MLFRNKTKKKKCISKSKLPNGNSNIIADGTHRNQIYSNYPGDVADVTKYWTMVPTNSNKYIAVYLKIKIK